MTGVRTRQRTIEPRWRIKPSRKVQSGRNYRAGVGARPRTNGYRGCQLPFSPGGVRQGEPNWRSVVGSSLLPNVPSELVTGLGDWDGQNGLVSSVVSASPKDVSVDTGSPASAGQRSHRLMLATLTSSSAPRIRLVPVPTGARRSALWPATVIV